MAEKDKPREKESFEDQMDRLEKINQSIRQGDMPLAQAVDLFEEGIALSRSLEKELSEMERRVEILTNRPDPNRKEEQPDLELFSEGQERR